MTIDIRLRIDTRAAILARRTTTGLVTARVTDENLAEAPDDVLPALAEVADKGEVLEGPGVVDTSFQSVLAGLRARQDREREHQAAVEREAVEARAAAARSAEEEIARRRRMEEQAARHEAAITRWVEENCDEGMIARRKAGFLDENEIIEEVMDQLFEITEDEHVTLKAHEACDCDKGCAGSVQYRVEPVEYLDTSQFATLEQIKEMAPSGATVTPQARKAVCPECSCTPIVRMTALVQLPWNGWMLQKVYALG